MASGAQHRHMRSFLVVANISKKQNVRTLIQCAAAFGVEEVLVAGQPNFSRATHVPGGMPPDLVIRQFADLGSCRDFLHGQGVQLMGVEIMDGAANVDEEPFEGSCAFMMGNEGSGMNARQKECCDGFLYISQHGGGTASLNVAVAASIVLHRFWAWRERWNATATPAALDGEPSPAPPGPVEGGPGPGPG